VFSPLLPVQLGLRQFRELAVARNKTNTVLGILQQVSSVKQWSPDVIVGLNGSNEFFMSKTFFNDILVLSLSATDSQLKTLPKSFYSLGIPDPYVVNAIIKFINQHNPGANLFITVAAESKEGVDFSNLLSQKYKEQHSSAQVIQRKFLTDNMNMLDMKTFMSGYQKGDVIIVMAAGYYSAIDLMNKIAGYLPNNPIFLTSSDNWGNHATPQIMKGRYTAFRMDTLTGSKDKSSYKLFNDNYKKIYHAVPQDAISFVTYQAIMSFVTALKQFPPPASLSMRDAILWSYQAALKKNPDWFRPPGYVVYELKNNQETYFETIP